MHRRLHLCLKISRAFFFLFADFKRSNFGQTLWKEKALLNIFFGFCRTRDNWLTLKWRLYSGCAHASKSFVRECFCFPCMRGGDDRTYWPTWKHEHSLSQSSRAIVLIARRVDFPWIFTDFPLFALCTRSLLHQLLQCWEVTVIFAVNSLFVD